MALEKHKEEFPSRENKQQSGDASKSRVKKDKNFQTKVIIRRLPPTMTEEQFLEQISPVPDHDYIYFVKGDMRLGQYSFTRAYINFLSQEDIFLFKEKFDGYVFLDTKGNEYPAIVEFAPFQKIPKKRTKKRDAKCGTIVQDPDYMKFLESLKNPEEITLPTAEVYLEEIESREKELKANNGVPKITTPLIEYLKQRKMEQQKLREEKREERKRKELEKKRVREEERRRRKAEKEKERGKEKSKEKECTSEKETVEEIEETPMSEDSKQSETVVQVLRNPEREKEKDQRGHVTFQKSKDYYVPTRPSKDKERNRKEWERERDKQREKVRARDRERQRERERPHNERPAMTRDKDRSRRDRDDRKSESNISETECSGKKGSDLEEVKKSTDSHLSDGSLRKTAKIDKSDHRHSFEDKRTNKNKRDNSCPGNVESLGCREQTKESDSGKSNIDNSKKNSSEETVAISDHFKSDAGLDCRDQTKDPRVDRRIRNKDRPSLEIYRPGMRRLGTQRNSPQKEISTSASNSSTPSPSPTPPLTVGCSKPQNRDGDKTKSHKSVIETNVNEEIQEDSL